MDGHFSTYTIAQAKLHLPSVVHLAERDGCVELTRRGKPVAVILSMEEYRNLKSPASNWWSKVEEWRSQLDSNFEGLEQAEVDAWRSDDSGRPPALFE